MKERRHIPREVILDHSVHFRRVQSTPNDVRTHRAHRIAVQHATHRLLALLVGQVLLLQNITHPYLAEQLGLHARLAKHFHHVLSALRVLHEHDRAVVLEGRKCALRITSARHFFLECSHLGSLVCRFHEIDLNGGGNGVLALALAPHELGVLALQNAPGSALPYP